ncbi:MAG: flagellar biosynthetic protein FliR [Gammaproteobacteria bacterium]
MVLSSAQIAAWLAAGLWPFLRISAFITAAPIFGNRLIPTRVRIGIALLLTVVIVPVISPPPAIDPVSAPGLLIAAQQVLIGAALGFALRLVFAVLEVGGQLIAQMMGLGFAVLVDPQNGVDVPVVSRLYIILATLVFLGLNGHLAIIEVVSDSFATLPVGSRGLGQEGLWALVIHAGWVFSSAVRMALPAIVALFIVNLAFGVMARAAPQLNIFAVGFPLTLIFGFFVMLLTLPSTLSQFDSFFDFSIAAVRLMGTEGN